MTCGAVQSLRIVVVTRLRPSPASSQRKFTEQPVGKRPNANCTDSVEPKPGCNAQLALSGHPVRSTAPCKPPSLRSLTPAPPRRRRSRRQTLASTTQRAISKTVQTRCVRFALQLNSEHWRNEDGTQKSPGAIPGACPPKPSCLALVWGEKTASSNPLPRLGSTFDGGGGPAPKSPSSSPSATTSTPSLAK